MGPRERADVLLPPFEMAIREGGARSVMHSYTDTDGVPAAADESLLTGLLRDTWGFDGTVVADYFGIAFLKTLHGVAADLGRRRRRRARRPASTSNCPPSRRFGAPAARGRRRRRGHRVAHRPRPAPRPAPEGDARPARPGLESGAARPRRRRPGRPGALRGKVDLDGPRTGSWPARSPRRPSSCSPTTAPCRSPGPAASPWSAPTRPTPPPCWAATPSPSTWASQHPDVPVGIDLPTLRDTLAAEFPDADITVAPRLHGIDDGDRSGIAEAVDAARDARHRHRRTRRPRGPVRPRHQRRGLRRGVPRPARRPAAPAGRAARLRHARGARPARRPPYALGRAVAESAAIVQSFFPGEAGTQAIAGRARAAASTPPDGCRSACRAARGPSRPLTSAPASPRPARSPTSTRHRPSASATASRTRSSTGATSPWTPNRRRPTGSSRSSFTVRNTGGRAGTEVVQLYLHDPVASVVQPVQRLVGYTRVDLEPGEARRVRVDVPADLASFTGRDGRRIVEPGDLELRLAASSTDARLTAPVTLTGPDRRVDHTRRFHAEFDPGAGCGGMSRTARHRPAWNRTRGSGPAVRPTPFRRGPGRAAAGSGPPSCPAVLSCRMHRMPALSGPAGSGVVGVLVAARPRGRHAAPALRPAAPVHRRHRRRRWGSASCGPGSPSRSSGSTPRASSASSRTSRRGGPLRVFQAGDHLRGHAQERRVRPPPGLHRVGRRRDRRVAQRLLDDIQVLDPRKTELVPTTPPTTARHASTWRR